MLASPEYSLILQAIELQAEQYSPITLAGMEGVKLMNRTDTKFVLPLHLLPQLLSDLEPHYRWLNVNKQVLCSYETLYFDTPALQLYHNHQTGRLNRVKVRQRLYTQSGLTFTEVKQKTNKGRTIKKRIEQPDSSLLLLSRPGCPNFGYGNLDPESSAFVNQHSGLESAGLRPVLWVGYTRITLVSNTSPERLTFDLDLMFYNGTKSVSFSPVVIAEVKQEAHCPSPFLRLIKQHGIRQGSVSKYCLGMLSLDGRLRHNRFKPQLLHLKKIISQA